MNNYKILLILVLILVLIYLSYNNILENFKTPSTLINIDQEMIKPYNLTENDKKQISTSVVKKIFKEGNQLDGNLIVNGKGDVTQSATIGSMDKPDWSGISHQNKSNEKDYALVQHKDGETILNAAENKEIGLAIGGDKKVKVGTKGNLEVNNNLKIKGDLLFSGKNKWIMHTPDDKRTTLYLAPVNNSGRSWNWNKQTSFENDGDVNFSKDANIRGNVNLKGQLTQSGKVKPRGWTGGVTTFDVYSDGGTVGVGKKGSLTGYINRDGMGFVSNKFGVGTNNPQEKLDVNGNVHVSGETQIGGDGDIRNPDLKTHISNMGIQFGGPNNGKQLDSAQISAGLHDNGNSLNIVGMSKDKNWKNRKVTVWAEGGMRVNGKVNSNNVVMGDGKIRNPDSLTHITDTGIQFGGPNNGKQIDSAQISSGLHDKGNSLNIVGMSKDKNWQNRKVTTWAEGGSLHKGPMEVNGDLKVTGKLKLGNFNISQGSKSTCSDCLYITKDGIPNGVQIGAYNKRENSSYPYGENGLFISPTRTNYGALGTKLYKWDDLSIHGNAGTLKTNKWNY